MAADDAVDAEPGRFIGHGRFEVADKLHRVLDFVLEESRQRPVGQVELPPDAVHHVVGFEQPVVEAGAQHRHRPGAPDDAVELVSVSDQETPSIGICVNGFLQDLHVAERHVVKVAQQLVVIAGHIDDIDAVFGLAQDRSHDVVVRLRPEDPLPHFPDVDDVADQIEILAVDGMEEVQQVIGAASTKT